MVAHLRKYFPDETEIMPESRLRRRIQQEVATAARYDIVDERDVAVYICVMFALRPDLSRDPEVAWVEGILTEPRLSPSDKVQLLQQRAEKELKDQTNA